MQDNATWLKGKHEIAFGFQAQLLHANPFNDAGIVPTLTLGISAANTNGLTAADLPGIRSADLTTANNLYANLAGIVSTAAQTFNVTSTTSGFVPGATNLRQLTHSTWAGYVQDKWKVRPNLTLNIGVRYEYWTPLDEKNSLYLAPRLENNSAQASVMDPNAVLDFIGSSSGRPFYKADKNNFAPNLGFAWDPFKNGKTSIRGGYMIAYVNDNVVTSVRNSVTTSSGLSFANTQSNLMALLSSNPTVAAPVYKVPRTLADNYAITTTSATGMPDPNLSTPYVHQWNIGIQQDVKGTLLSARYVGNRGSSLLRAIDYNQILYNANGFLADFLRAQNNAALAEKAGLGYVGSYNANVPGSVPLTVFPLLSNAGFTSSTNQTYLKQGQIGELANQYMVNKTNGSVQFYTNPNVQGANVLTNGGESSYHALQLEVTRRTRKGLQGQFSYTFGKSLSNTSGDSQTDFEPLLDNANPQLERARTPYDIRHVIQGQLLLRTAVRQGQAVERQRGHQRRPGQLDSQRHLELSGGCAVFGAFRLRDTEPRGAFHGDQHGIGERDHDVATGAADGRAVHDGQRALLRIAHGDRQRWPRRGAGRLAAVRGAVVLQPDGGQCGQPAAPHVHRSVAVELGHGDQEIIQVPGSPFGGPGRGVHQLLEPPDVLRSSGDGGRLRIGDQLQRQQLDLRTDQLHELQSENRSAHPVLSLLAVKPGQAGETKPPAPPPIPLLPSPFVSFYILAPHFGVQSHPLAVPT